MSLAYIEKCTNLFGGLAPDVRKRLEAVVKMPAHREWDDAYTIIINGERHITLWQAWIATDPTAPLSGPVTDSKGRRVSGWAKVPDQLALYRALRYGVNA